MVDVVGGVVAWAWVAVLAGLLFHFWSRISVNASIFRAIFERVIDRERDWARAEKILRSTDCPLADLGLHALSLRRDRARRVTRGYRSSPGDGPQAAELLAARAEDLVRRVHLHRVAVFVTPALLLALMAALALGSPPVHFIVAVGLITLGAPVLFWGTWYTRRDLREAAPRMARWVEMPNDGEDPTHGGVG